MRASSEAWAIVLHETQIMPIFASASACNKDILNIRTMTIKHFLCSAMAMTTLGVGALPAQQRMTPEMLLEMARVGEASLSPDGRLAVYQVSFPSIEQNKSRSELFVVGLDGKTRRTQLTNTPAGEYSPRWSASGQRITFLCNETGSMQLWSMAADGSDRRQLTAIEGGIESYIVSPDETMVLYVKQIKYGQRTADRYPDLPKASGRVIDSLMYKHWDEWVETIPHIFYARLGDSPITSGRDILEGEPYEAPMKPFASIDDVAWSADSKSIAYASRKKEGRAYSLSTNSDIYIYSLESGQTRNVTEGMMGYDTEPTFSPDGKYIAWTSMERDGFEADIKRLFVMDLKTGQKTFLTEGWEYNVDHPQWSADSKRIYFIATVEAEASLFEIPLRGKKIRKISQDGPYNYVSMQVRNGQLLAGRQSLLAPTDLFRVDLKTGQATPITQENASTLGKLGNTRTEKRWMTTTDGKKMLVWVVLPPDFDPTKQYPSLLYCQGGPQSPVSQYFSFRWNPRLMAEQGYIVIMPNRRGVPGFGKEWNEQISGDYSGQNIRDYLTAVDEMKKEPYIDHKRIGAVGASYGGYSVFYLAGHHEGRFSAFIAHAGIFNLEMQYMETEEMWFANWDMGGAPWDKHNATAQRTFANSPHRFVDKWDTPILVIHGELDYRILASQGMAAFNSAQLRGIPSQLLIFPDENHWVLRPQNALLWQRTFFGWLDKWLK